MNKTGNLVRMIIVAGMLAAFLVIPVGASRPHGGGFIVDSVGDTPDANPGDGICDDGSGDCTLRAAIQEANAYEGNPQIGFDETVMSSYYIYLSSALPPLSTPMTIDGSSVWNDAEDRPGVTLNCSGGSFSGLTLDSNQGVIYGLFIINCFNGIAIYGDTNTVGGTGQGQRNVISSNTVNGVFISGSVAHDNVVQGNWIGLSITGDTKAPNQDGVIIAGGAYDNTIGGTTTAAGNYISGNTYNGVQISDTGSNGNRLGNNLIGQPANGSLDVGNGQAGVLIYNGPQNTVIGGIYGANAIAHNGSEGVSIRSASYNMLEGNNIFSNGNRGVYIWSGSTGNQVIDNTITYNTLDGVRVQDASTISNLIIANGIHSNNGAGIELIDGGNGELAAPTISSATSSQVIGTGCANCMIHIYSDDDNEGGIYHGTVNADGSGNWTYNGSITGPNATATNTDGSNNTSEFSEPAPVGGGVFYRVYLPIVRRN